MAVPGLGTLGRRAAPLNKYAVRFRYPGQPYAPPIEEAQQAVALARELVSEIVTYLPDSQVRISEFRPGLCGEVLSTSTA
jgi:hypothetical protein